MHEYYPHRLDVERLIVPVYLGVPDAERAAPQRVELDISLHFATPLAAWLNDEAGYMCYGDLGQRVLAFVKGKHFKLIEFLVFELHKEVRKYIAESEAEAAESIALTLHVRKPALPVAFHCEAAAFTYSDLPPSAAAV